RRERRPRVLHGPRNEHDLVRLRGRDSASPEGDPRSPGPDADPQRLLPGRADQEPYGCLRKTITYSHDLAARQEVVTDREGAVRVLAYDERGNVTKETQPDGKVIERTFDARNNRLSETEPHDPANLTPATTTYTYDPTDNLLTTTDPQNHTTQYTYNGLKQVLTTKDARDKTTTNVYDAQGNLLTTTDALNQVTTYA